jgi:small-conductance mechanosensitive channel
LPLVRSFTSVTLVIVVVLMALSISGVAIAPLLAGAGVVGIAIGFGAQKLVQDVLSGIFFLLDDAFRCGEYIEAAGLRGTVEQISLRSMRLRHHLGAVQTIPYSEIATVKNLSRDWVTMKLEFRLPYDTDIEQVRKIVKKVGQEMLNDAEIGPQVLLPLKSQGVMRVEESALIFRMKFTCKPGEQWVIRREAYRQVKDALEANGIHFAHRSVHVLIPDNPAQAQAIEHEDAARTGIIGAAAAQAAMHPDLLRSNRIDDDRGKNLDEDEGSA